MTQRKEENAKYFNVFGHGIKKSLKILKEGRPLWKYVFSIKSSWEVEPTKKDNDHAT